MRRLTKEIFINKAKEKHGNKYDYSQVDYINNKTLVDIICPIHGSFKQKPFLHLNGHGCPLCGKDEIANKNRATLEEFLKQAQSIHGNKYNYSKVEYINNNTKICVTCPQHGDFWVTPNNHLSRSSGCPYCAKNKMDINNFIKQSNVIHNNSYDYSQAVYINSQTKVKIICRKHGEFWQTPNMHLRGQGCPKCATSHLEREMMSLLDKHNIEYIFQYSPDWANKMRFDFFIPTSNMIIECQGIQHYQPVDFSGKGMKHASEEFKKLQKRDILKKKLCL